MAALSTISSAPPCTSTPTMLRRMLQPTPLLSFTLFKTSPSVPFQTTPLLSSTFSPSTASGPLLLSTLPPLRSFSTSQSQLLEFPNDVVPEDRLDDAGSENETGGSKIKPTTLDSNRSKLPDLTVKEKKELASYAHSLGKKLKSQQVGKSGVTDSVVTALLETLEANELLKLKIHGSCPGELDDVVKQLEEATGSVVVGRIGRTVIVYKPSLSKLKAEEKKKQAMKAFTQKQTASRYSAQRNVERERQSSRGRRGSSRI